MAEAAVVLTDALDVRARLRALGVPEDVLLDAARNGESAKASCTQNHPPTFGGMAMHAEMVRSLRDGLIPKGWTRDDTRNFSTVVRPDGAFAIAVARGDGFTGNPDEAPTTMRRKGVTAHDAVALNFLLPWDDVAVVQNAQVELGEQPVSTWFLLHTRVEDELRCELSRPTEINESGFVEKWSERILLGPINLEPRPLKAFDDQPVDPIVNVKRRATGN